MKLDYASLRTCHSAKGLVLIIDVLRAFSNAAYAFNSGTEKIFLVSTVEEALKFRENHPNILIMGEVDGLPPKGFDFGNSPTQTTKLDLGGRIIVQRTGAGTQGAVRCINAESMLAVSFVVAGATVKHILKVAPPQVTFVITGGYKNDEDLSCAEYLEALLKGQNPDQGPYIKRVYASRDAEAHLDLNQPEFPESDLDYCTRTDRFNFYMPITRESGQLVMRAMQP